MLVFWLYFCFTQFLILVPTANHLQILAFFFGFVGLFIPNQFVYAQSQMSNSIPMVVYVGERQQFLLFRVWNLELYSL